MTQNITDLGHSDILCVFIITDEHMSLTLLRQRTFIWVIAQLFAIITRDSLYVSLWSMIIVRLFFVIIIWASI